MYKRILVPIDGSSTAALGLKHALGLAKEQNARVRVLNVLDDLFLAVAPDAYAVTDLTYLMDTQKDEGQKALREASALAERSGVAVETAMIEARGRPVSDVILADARKWRADVIVMGTHGRRGFNRLLLGSDAERVLRETAVPVLLVRAAESGARAAKTRARTARRLRRK